MKLLFSEVRVTGADALWDTICDSVKETHIDELLFSIHVIVLVSKDGFCFQELLLLLWTMTFFSPLASVAVAEMWRCLLSAPWMLEFWRCTRGILYSSQNHCVFILAISMVVSWWDQCTCPSCIGITLLPGMHIEREWSDDKELCVFVLLD